MGQKDSVFVQYMLAKDTADDLVWPIIEGKVEVRMHREIENRVIVVFSGSWQGESEL